jgi:molecular chaperone DnaK (HSP70)
MKNKNITTNELARMVKKGFDDTTKEMRSGFKQVNKRFDRIENLILVEHRTRIENLEKKVLKLEEILAVK